MSRLLGVRHRSNSGDLARRYRDNDLAFGAELFAGQLVDLTDRSRSGAVIACNTVQSVARSNVVISPSHSLIHGNSRDRLLEFLPGSGG